MKGSQTADVSKNSAKVGFTCLTCGYEFSLFALYDGEVVCPICDEMLTQEVDGYNIALPEHFYSMLIPNRDFFAGDESHASCNASDSQSAHPA